jgi:D-alanine-D-alanine ligase
MMAHRLILTAVGSSKAAVAVPGAFVKPSRVTVLLGDPSLPDSIKRNGQFNEEDLDTIKRMKTALSELEDYKFTYVQPPEPGRSILTEPPEFVLNLCDEGFLNDAFKELHVPALLEMFDVPYTGAGPACLGFCYNKGLVDSVARSLDVPTPMESFVGADDTMATLPSTFPALIKPNFGDSSIGITQNAVVHNMEELMNYVDWLRETYGACSLLIQEFLTGPEYTVGIVGNPGLAYHVLPLPRWTTRNSTRPA